MKKKKLRYKKLKGMKKKEKETKKQNMHNNFGKDSVRLIGFFIENAYYFCLACDEVAKARHRYYFL